MEKRVVVFRLGVAALVAGAVVVSPFVLAAAVAAFTFENWGVEPLGG